MMVSEFKCNNYIGSCDLDFFVEKLGKQITKLNERKVGISTTQNTVPKCPQRLFYNAVGRLINQWLFFISQSNWRAKMS